MKLIEITERSAWERFQTTQPWSQFTQSWEWGEMRASDGIQVRRFALVDDSGAWLVAAQLEFRARRLTGYWHAPRGPVFSAQVAPEEYRSLFRKFLEELDRAKLQCSLFWRFEPLVELARPEGLMPLSFRRAPALNPASTLLLDLTKSQEQLLEEMHPKTRYNIRVAAKHGVTTRIGTHPDDLTAFLRLMDETAARDKFVQHDAAYLKRTYEALSKQGMARLRLAEHNGQVLAANFEIVYGGAATYLYGTSSSEARNFMAPFALQWDAITQAQRDGCKLYDFWGVNPPSKAMFGYKPSWEGITRFKQGWGGRQVDLYGTWDLPLFHLLYMAIFPRRIWRS